MSLSPPIKNPSSAMWKNFSRFETGPLERKDIKKNSVNMPPYGILIERQCHDPGFSNRPYYHQYAVFIYLLSGQCKCILGKQEYQLYPGSAVVLEEGQLHQVIDSTGKTAVIFVLSFSQEVANQNKPLLETLTKPAKPLAILPHYAKQIECTLRQMLHEQSSKPPQYEIAIQQCFGSILLNLYRMAAAGNGKETRNIKMNSSASVRRVLDYVRDNYYEHHSLPDIAKMANLSSRQFANICHKQTGKSFVSFVNSLKIEKAKKLLKTTEMPVAAIAFEVGFEELSSFYRAFKKLYGKPPLMLREEPS